MEHKDQTIIKIRTVSQEEEFLPQYMTQEAAGADVKALLKEPMIISPGQSALVPTGLFFEIPHGYEIQVRPRSGLAFKHQITVLNTPGTIDSDYRGELKIILINHGKEDFTVTHGMRIAQIVVAEVVRGNYILSSELGSTDRGENGFGHTGHHHK